MVIGQKLKELQQFMYFWPLLGCPKFDTLTENILFLKLMDRFDVVSYTMEVIPQLNQYLRAEKLF